MVKIRRSLANFEEFQDNYLQIATIGLQHRSVEMTQPLLAKPVALIVEDEILVRMMAVDVFEQAGFSVLEASNATEAMAILEDRDDVAALFTDIEMPGGPSGLVLAREIHARNPDMVLLIASGHLVPLAKDIPNGAEYFRKPYDPDHVVARAHEMITDLQPPRF